MDGRMGGYGCHLFGWFNCFRKCGKSSGAFRQEASGSGRAYSFTESVEIAFRYGGSRDGGEFLPEIQYGGVISCEIFKNTCISAELLTGEYDNDDRTTTATAQLAVVF